MNPRWYIHILKLPAKGSDRKCLDHCFLSDWVKFSAKNETITNAV